VVFVLFPLEEEEHALGHNKSSEDVDAGHTGADDSQESGLRVVRLVE
jgi:hypothetical protein